MNPRALAHLWISVGVLVPLFTGVIVFDLVGYYFLAWSCAIALVSFGSGRMLWAMVELHYSRKQLQESAAETGKVLDELAELRRHRRIVMQDLLVKGRLNGKRDKP